MDHLMYSEDDLLPISALQHLLFCERQWALIHLEGQWVENRLTAEGRVMHERVHEVDAESRGEVRVLGELPVHVCVYTRMKSRRSSACFCFSFGVV